MTEIKHWTTYKSVGGKFITPVNRLMLSADGWIDTQYRKKRGTVTTVLHRVLFDRRYVAEKFHREYLQRLGCTFDEFVEMMSDLPFPETDKESDKNDAP